MLQRPGTTSRLTQIFLLATSVGIFLLLITYRHGFDTETAAQASMRSSHEVAAALSPNSNRPTPIPPSADVRWHKPWGQEVIALVFYGRKSRVEILNCYLERNLVAQGGWLDEVHFVRNTKNEEDLEYLENLVIDHPRYKVLDIADDDLGRRYENAWKLMKPGAIYVKIDDDVVWIADDTIPKLVMRKLQQPEYFVVSANLINSPLMSKVHYDQGAYHPYLPAHESLPLELYDQFEMRYQAGNSTWDFTRYPVWVGPKNYSLSQDEGGESLSPVWLRMPNDSDITRTPIRDITYDTWGPGCKSWSVAAQSHLSLFENLHSENTSVYHHGLQEVWFTDYERLSINMIAVDASDIKSQLPIDEGIVDEEWITVNLPRRLGKHVAVETGALAAHFSFGFQLGIEFTDLLGRYKSYAYEKACLRPEQYGVPIFEG